jgi:hypothetical protein
VKKMTLGRGLHTEGRGSVPLPSSTRNTKYRLLSTTEEGKEVEKKEATDRRRKQVEKEKEKKEKKEKEKAKKTRNCASRTVQTEVLGR